MNEIYKKLYQLKIDKLLEWRNGYALQEYPEKVVINLFYELYTLKDIWPSINNIFGDKLFDVRNIPKDNLVYALNKKYPEDDERLWSAFNSLCEDLISRRLKNIHPVLYHFLANNVPVGKEKYSNFKDLIKMARKNQSNSAIEEIEYAYVFYGMLSDIILLWGAFGLLGYDRIISFIRTTGIIDGNVDFRNLESVINSFHPATSMRLTAGHNKLYEKLDGLYDN